VKINVTVQGGKKPGFSIGYAENVTLCRKQVKTIFDKTIKLVRGMQWISVHKRNGANGSTKEIDN
jgi:hypothetical protein